MKKIMKILKYLKILKNKKWKIHYQYLKNFGKNNKSLTVIYLFILAKSSKKNIVKEILRNAKDKRNIIPTKVTESKPWRQI